MLPIRVKTFLQKETRREKGAGVKDAVLSRRAKTKSISKDLTQKGPKAGESRTAHYL